MKLIIELDEFDPNVPNNIKHLRDLMREARKGGRLKLYIEKPSHCYTSYSWPAVFHDIKVTVVTPPKKKRPKIRNKTIFRFPVKAH